MLPRYFVARSSASLPALHSALLAFVTDSFRIPFAGPEACVAVDRAGTLHVFTENVQTALPAALRAELGRHELALARPCRQLPAATVWVLAVEGLDQPRAAPGLNDPIVLEGTLYGPFGAPSAPGRHAGGLTVTRGDLLSGFADAAADAFVTTGLGGKVARCLHAMLPAGETGRDDIVLAYLLTPSELAPTDAGNEPLVAQLLFDVLVALQHDLREIDGKHPFVATVLPVPDRRAVEEALEQDGWQIRGNEAVNLSSTFRSGLGGLLVDVLGVPEDRRRKLPREAGVDEFIALAREAVHALGGWPNVRYRAMREGAWGPVPAPSVPKSSGPPAAFLPKPVSDWQSDFGSAVDVAAGPSLQSQNQGVKRLLSRQVDTPAQPKKARHSDPRKRDARPTWMDDFE